MSLELSVGTQPRSSLPRKWRFRWRMLLYRGDKLQVSVVASGEHFEADCQLAPALSDCCT